VIVVFVRKAGPPIVFEATRDLLVTMVQETSATGSYVATLPPGSVTNDFDSAWLRLTRDMQSAAHFETVREAIDAYRSDRGNLTMAQHSRILGSLLAIEDGRGNAAPSPVFDVTGSG
jgi:hypothetical protein